MSATQQGSSASAAPISLDEEAAARADGLAMLLPLPCSSPDPAPDPAPDTAGPGTPAAAAVCVPRPAPMAPKQPPPRGPPSGPPCSGALPSARLRSSPSSSLRLGPCVVGGRAGESADMPRPPLAPSGLHVRTIGCWCHLRMYVAAGCQTMPSQIITAAGLQAASTAYIRSQKTYSPTSWGMQLVASCIAFSSLQIKDCSLVYAQAHLVAAAAAPSSPPGRPLACASRAGAAAAAPSPGPRNPSP